MKNSTTSPLHQAVLDNDAALIKTLLEQGADINAPDNNNQWTPLHIATGFGTKEYN